MPTSQEESVKISKIISEYLDDSDAKELMTKLDSEVGQKTDNDSLKVSLHMLKSLYEPLKTKKIDQVWPIALGTVVVGHMLVVFINVIAFFVLPFTYPIHIWMPLNSFILITIFSRSLCPLTRLENVIRKKIGLPEIYGFVGFYIIKPIKKKFSYHSK